MKRSPGFVSRIVRSLGALVWTCGAIHAPALHAAEIHRPDILIITVDTLRADRLGSAGYSRPTSGHIDALLGAGARFTNARTVEPLTTPSLSSLLTSLHPHQHGATRNGLRVLPGLVSLPRLLRGFGYETAAFVGNWTLRRKLSGLDEHFESYAEVLTRKRWFGMVSSEATAEDLTTRAVAWLQGHAGDDAGRPFLLWVHYVDPHAPYNLHPEFAEALGVTQRDTTPPGDRYDTEIAFTDQAVGELLRALRKARPRGDTLVIFAADHGESLGEHGSWGHGRELYDQTVMIPMGISWPGHLPPVVIGAPASILDIAPTVVGLLGLPSPKTFQGRDWHSDLESGAQPGERTLYFQAHKGAVMSRHASARARRKGLLAVGLLSGDRKEILRLADRRLGVFDLRADPGETKNLAAPSAAPSRELAAWAEQVIGALKSLDANSVEPMDDETIEKLRSLGYIH